MDIKVLIPPRIILVVVLGVWIISKEIISWVEFWVEFNIGMEKPFHDGACCFKTIDILLNIFDVSDDRLVTWY